MKVSAKSMKGESLLSVSDTLQLMLSFGSFTLLLVGTVVAILKNDEKK